jgi:taurine dioxygenase
MNITPNSSGFGAHVTNLELSNLTDAEVSDLRSAWLAHQVLAIPDQPMTHAMLEAFTLRLGEFGHDPYVAPIDGHQNILEVRREPDEKVAPFGSAWHSDWSFQACPPAATLLHAKEIPPIGGDTWYADGYAAFAALEPETQDTLSSLTALHSARRPYSHQGFVAGGGQDRSMKILPSDSALEVMEHPLVRTHPETKRKVLWINHVYTIGIKGLDSNDADQLLGRLLAHSVEERFVYKHRWAPNMLTLWDNRSVQHFAQGGYDGHRRVLHRTIVAGDRPY